MLVDLLIFPSFYRLSPVSPSLSPRVEIRVAINSCSIRVAVHRIHVSRSFTSVCCVELYF